MQVVRADAAALQACPGAHGVEAVLDRIAHAGALDGQKPGDLGQFDVLAPEVDPVLGQALRIDQQHIDISRVQDGLAARDVAHDVAPRTGAQHVVGADLPDDQIGFVGLDLGAQAVGGLEGRLAADPPVEDVDRHLGQARAQVVLEPGHKAQVAAAGAHALDAGRPDRQDVQAAEAAHGGLAAVQAVAGQRQCGGVDGTGGRGRRRRLARAGQGRLRAGRSGGLGAGRPGDQQAKAQSGQGRQQEGRLFHPVSSPVGGGVGTPF